MYNSDPLLGERVNQLFRAETGKLVFHLAHLLNVPPCFWHSRRPGDTATFDIAEDQVVDVLTNGACVVYGVGWHILFQSGGSGMCNFNTIFIMVMDHNFLNFRPDAS